MTVVGIVAIVLAALAAGSLVWRWARWPCPHWLVPLLENPWFEAVAGAETLFARAELRPGMCVLDAGCGPGRLAVPAASRVGPTGRVVALDLQEEMLDRLRSRTRSLGLGNVDLVHAALGEDALPADAFDVALLVTVLGEIRDPVPALQEIRRSLRPGGILSITEVLPDPHYQRLARVRALASQAGFREGRVFRGWLSYTLNLSRPLPAERGAQGVPRAAASHEVG